MNYGYKCGSECCSVHTYNDDLRDSRPLLNAAVTPETCSVYVAKYYTAKQFLT